MGRPTLGRLDPVALEIAWSRLIAIADEAAVSLVRTSFSTIVREAKDYTCILLDGRGRSIAQPTTSAPSFTGTMPRTMKHFLACFPLEAWEPGDLAITNDPWMGTGHHLDVNVARPIFFGQELVAFVGLVAHMADMGGLLWSAEAREVFEEGLQIPICKLFVGGRPNADVFGFIRANVRVPETVLGDLHAMATAAEVADRRLNAFLATLGREGWDGLVEEVIGRCEAAMRAEIRRLPEGTFRHELLLDGYEEPLPLRAAVTVEDGGIRVDYAGTARQVPRAMNSPYTYTYAYTAHPLKCLLNPAIPNNEGTFRAIEVHAPEGSLVNPRPPVAVAARNLTGHALYAVLFGALAPALPERVIAECSAPRPIIVLSGFHRSGRRFQNMFFIMGGFGARGGEDGLACLPYPTNTSATPVEVMESTTPILVERKEIVPDTGGPGKFRGGCAQEIVVRNLSPHPMRVSILSERTKSPPQGLFGGRPGGSPRFALEDGRPADPKGITTVGPGEAILVRTHGGGGYGPPGERDPQVVAGDVEEGFVSREAARAEYGVVVPEPGREAPAAVRAGLGEGGNRMDGASGSGTGQAWTIDGAELYRRAGIGSRVGFGARPAVLVVDLIRGCTEKDSPLPPLMDLDLVVEKTAELLRAARARAVPVLFTTLGPYRPDLRDVGPIAVKMPGLKIFAHGAPWSEVDPRLGMRPDEFLIWKKWQSAFFGTDLRSILTGLGVDTLVVTGCVTSGCVRATATDAASHGFRVILPRECIGDRTAQIHEANLFDLNAKNGDVVPLAEVLAYLERLAPAEAGR